MEYAGNITGSVKMRKDLVSKFGHTYYGVALTTSPLPSSSYDSESRIIESVDGFEETLQTSPVRLSKKSKRRLQRYEALLKIGQYERATAELDIVKKYVPNRIKALAWLGVLYTKAHAPNRSLRLQNIALGAKTSKDDYEDIFWRLYYPLANWEEISDQSKKRGIDPFLALAVIRQESAFDRKALSPANARGLMQLIPPTAKRVYQKLEMEKKMGAPFDPETLFDPKVNITLGVAYLAELISYYDGATTPALAAYNAGRKAVNRWLKGSDGEPGDEFIENIPYTETSEYVKRVLRNWILYKRIYEEDMP
jgi:soluble lytic murein transglycosylase-like protein